MGKYIFKSAIELADMIREGKASSTEIVKDHLEQIKRYNANLNAVVILQEEEALREAAKCDAEAEKGKFRGELHGVPMTVKEQFWVKGTKSTLNFKALKDWTAPEDALVVSRLREAGAIILGKTNVCKNLADYQVNGDIYPEGVNPYHPDYTPGGSSGGSAAALASGMVPIELGGDFGGSIRIPANYCGVYGLKPTENTVPGHGLAPRTKKEKGSVFHMATAGPMARSVKDLELVWKIIRGPYTGNRNIAPIDWKEPSDKKPEDYRIAWVDGWKDYPASDYIKDEIKKFAGVVEEMGCKVEYAEPGNNLHERSLGMFIQLFGLLISQDLPRFITPFLKMNFKRGLLKGMDKFSKEFNASFSKKFLPYSEAIGLRRQIVGEWEQFFQKYDLLICPISFGPAFKRCKIGTPLEFQGKKMIYTKYAWPYVACFNASGHPALNIPLGTGIEGLPVGIQVVGPYWSEPVMLRFAEMISRYTKGFVIPETYQS